MEWTRTIKRYMKGDDVTAVKQKLLELGYLKTAVKPAFGNDSYKGVKSFQDANGLPETGSVDEATWDLLFDEEPEPEPGPTPTVDVPEWLSDDARSAISVALASVTELRRNICLEALQWAIDPDCPTETLKGFYVRGANTYNFDLSANIMTEAKLSNYFKITKYKSYYSSSKSMMIRQSEADGYDKIGADCSGAIVGYWRKFGIVDPTFDANANTLYKSYCTKTTTPQAGDLAWMSGHIGLYVGGGYVVEFAGGPFGCQLTKTSKRVIYSYVTGTSKKYSSWTAYGDPKYY